MSDPVTRLNAAPAAPVMTKWIERIRGAVGMVVIWVVGWSFVGALLGLLVGALFSPDGIEATRVAGVIRLSIQASVACGGTFSVVLAIAGRRRTFDEMSLPLFAAWGAFAASVVLGLAILGGGVEQFLAPAGLIVASVVVLLGAGSAAGSLALARRADDRELLDAGADIAEVGLTKEERRELLGT